MAEFQFQNDELEFVDDYNYETSDSEGETSFIGSNDKEDDFDDDDLDFEYIGKSTKADTTAEEARKGKDIQGIPWERLNFTRDKYRETRLKQYQNYQRLQASGERSQLL